MLNPHYESWAKQAAGAFEAGGAAKGAGLQFARLYVALWAAGLNPRITSVWRDPARQDFLRAEWDAGRGSLYGLRVRPASTSQHSLKDWLGRPASNAIDMPSSDDRRAAEIARALGLGAGIAFSTPDPGHYFYLGA